MAVEYLQLLSIIAYIIAAALLLTAVALFFLFDVPKLYGDISGRTAKKAIEAIRKQNEATGNKAYKPSHVNQARGKLTDKITKSGRLESPPEGPSIGVATEKLETATLMYQTNETQVLEENFFQSGETTVLEQPDLKTVTPISSPLSEFSIEVEMGFMGSTEIIE